MIFDRSNIITRSLTTSTTSTFHHHRRLKLASTILHAAVCSDPGPTDDSRAKNLDAVKALLTRAPLDSLKKADDEGWSPLHSAASSGRNGPATDALISLLLLPLGKEGVDLLTSGKRTPLHYAASKGHAGIVASLLKAGADAAAVDGTGATPLHRAAGGAGSLDVVRLLLDYEDESKKKKVKIDARDRWGRTPLHAAAAAGRSGAALLLVSRGASVEAEDSERQTPLDVAAAEGGADAGKQLAKQLKALASGEISVEDVLG